MIYKITYWGFLAIIIAVILYSCSDSTEPKNNNNNNGDGPNITSISANSSFVGYPLDLNGKKFGSVQGASYVEINGVKVTKYYEWFDNSIRIRIPEGAASGKVIVHVAGTSSNSVDLEIKPASASSPPVISDFDNASPFPRTQLGLTGLNFGEQQMNSFVTFNGIIAESYISWKDKKIVLLVPTGATTGEVIVYVDGLASEPKNLIISKDNILLDQVIIPAGSFMMGATDEPEAYNSPKHQVTITKPFYMSVYEINQDVWALVAKNLKDQSYNTDNPQNPVERVSWINACNFCNILSLRERFEQVYTINGNNVTANFEANGYRLPTEAEWEFAALGGGDSKYGLDSNGNNGLASSMGWNNGNSDNKTHPVGLKQPNAYGLHDILGNVLEWCWDWYVADYDDAGSIDPKGPDITDDKFKVLRGGCYTDDKTKTTVTYRQSYRYDGIQSEFYIGFRVVRNYK